ncbi:ATP-dependent DNA helicase RRM3-like [Pecten maximus]|uniref:ATP-dependent DNA helicase RRM3-like n=1 Tax=Pecten maximus TaxID=6579 RepID=UPI0014587DDB|nr:ATP-dependent DNA helicase RRM3-like [Pecten maximus]
MLLTVHRRLCDLMGSDEPFGGVSVLAVGDLLQLPHVAQKPVFSPPSDQLAAIYGSLWCNHFKIIELTESQRQKDDTQFANILNRVRTGSQTSDDLATLSSREIDKTSPLYPTDATHIFAYNRHVDEHNAAKLETMDKPVYIFKAEDSKKDDQTASIDTSTLKDMAGGLPTKVSLVQVSC